MIDFDQAYKEYRPYIGGVLINKGAPVNLIDDYIQETFAKAWKHRDKFNPEIASFGTWITTIAIRVYTHDVKKRVYRAGRLKEHKPETSFIPDYDWQNPRLIDAIKTLPEVQRRDLIAHFYGGESVVEIARRYNKSKQAVQQVIKSAVKNVKKGIAA